MNIFYIYSHLKKLKSFKQRVKILFSHTAYYYFLYILDFWLLFKKKQPIAPNTLLIVKTDAIGDYVLFRNFLELIKKNDRYRNYKITLCGNAAWKDIAEKFDSNIIDNFIWINRSKFISNLRYRKNLLKKINETGFEIAIQPTYSREFIFGDAIIRASQAKERIGSAGDLSNMTHFQKSLSASYYTKFLAARREIVFEFYRNKEFFELFLGEKIFLKRPFFYEQANKKNIKKYIIVMPGAGAKFRRWECTNFSKIIDYIVNKYGIKKVFIAGGETDIILAEKIHNYCESDAEILIVAGKQTLPEFIDLVNEATLLLTNETSSAHIGVATKTKTISIANGNHFGRFSPYPKDISEDIAYIYPQEIREKMNDLEYLKRTYGNSSTLDINSIKVEDVLPTVDFILQGSVLTRK